MLVVKMAAVLTLFTGLLAPAVSPAATLGTDGVSPVPEGAIYFTMCPPGTRDDIAGCLSYDDSPLGDKEEEITDVELFVLALGATEPHQITDNDVNEFAPVWSPDGSEVVVSTDSIYDGDCQLQIISIPSGIMRPLTLPEEFMCSVALDWSPDGEWILYKEWDYEGPANLYKIRPSGLGRDRLTGYHSEFQWVMSARWTSDGRILFVSQGIIRPDHLNLMDADGSNWSLIKATDLSTSIEVSPDRRHAAYAEGGFGREPGMELVLMRSDGKHLSRWIVKRRRASQVSWSPDGSKIAYESYPRNDLYEHGAIGVYDLAKDQGETLRGAGSRPVAIPTTLEWSPRSTYVAFEISDPRTAATASCVAAIDGSGIYRVTPFRFNGDLWSWRPHASCMSGC